MHILSILLPFIFTLFSQQKQTAKPKIIALSHATLIDGTGAEPLYDSLILIQNGIIIAVGPREKIDIPNGSEWLDYAGRFIVPGLIDMHVHLDEVSTPEAFPLFGVTAVRDVGSRLVTIQRL